MKNNISAYIDNAITFILLIVVGLTPLLFLNQTTEFFEMPKLIFLVASTILLVGLWICSWIIKGKVVITRTPLDIPLLILLGAVLLSTYFSPSRYLSIYGNFPRVHGSAVSWVVYILLYFVTVSHLKTLGKVKTFLYVVYASGLVVAAISLLSFFHLYLPVDFAKAVNFTPTGSSFSTLAFLLMLLPLPLLSTINPNKYIPTPLALALSILFGVTIVFIGSLPTYILLAIVVALCVFVSKASRLKKTAAMFAIPVGVIALTFVLAYLPLPGNVNKLQQMEFNFPKDVQLPLSTSWKITVSAFRDAPLLGTGPSTYLFDFTGYKPVEFNALNLWNFSFDTAYNEFLQTLATLGIVGLLALLFVSAVVLMNAWKNLSLDTTDAHQDSAHVVAPALAMSGVVAIALLIIHPTTLVSLMTTLFVLGAFMMSQKSIREKVMELSMGLKASTSDNRHFDLFPIIIFILFLIGVFPASYQGYTMVLADYNHRLALAQANKSGTQTYQYLQKAEALNPQVDLYRVDMAQINFALANALAAQKGPSKSNPNGSLTDQDKQTIQTLLAQAIAEGKAAVLLNPRSSRNWEVLGSIYRNIAGVAKNSLPFALDAYGQAIQRDPLNPALRLSVGGIYYSAKNYDLATRFFSDAANLKPDYANAYYNLAIALRDNNDLQNALAVAQQTVAILQKNNATNTPDYKIATDLVDTLKAKIGNGPTAQNNTNVAGATTQQAPAAQTNSALNSNIPNVNANLGNPPQVTPAPSVKPNPSAKLPQENPTQAPQANK